MAQPSYATRVLSKLSEPYRLGHLELPNRMTPLAGNRGALRNVPTSLTARYYAKRASAGRIISEATQVAFEEEGYEATPRIHSPARIEGWRDVTRAVHASGGRIFLQLWHVGRVKRVSHVSLQPGGQFPVAPSAIQANTKTFIGGEFAETSRPHALRLEEIPGVIMALRQGVANAIAAGFDGVEPAANGYLLDQFPRDGANPCDDAYSSLIANRSRLLIDVFAEVICEAGNERVGVHLSAVTPPNDISDSNPNALFAHVIQGISALAPVYTMWLRAPPAVSRISVRLWTAASKLPQHLHRQQRLRLRNGDRRYRKRVGGSHLVRQGVPHQSGSGPPLACRRSAQRPRQVDVLRRRRKRLYRLPIFQVGVLVSGCPARALCRSDLRCLQFCMN
jgi:N-ethylmaleimide reductase